MESNWDNDISEQIKNWNPMRDAYNDSNFNKYTSGPGAELDDNLQKQTTKKKNKEDPYLVSNKFMSGSGAELGDNLQKQTAQKKNKKDPYLVFKNIPQNLTLNGLLNICSTYGKPVRGGKNDSDVYFVNFASLNDMERVFSGLQNNSYGFKVFIGNRIKKDQQKNQPTAPIPDLPSFPKKSIDYERSYQTSSRNPPRPILPKKPLVTTGDYENSSNFLNIVDPQRHFLIEDDAHELERLGCCEKNIVEDGKFNIYTGRAYYVMPKKDKEFIKEKQKTTRGSFNANAETFLLPSPVNERVKSGPCESCGKLCVMMCARCSAFYCSSECQIKEWQKHRYVCGKPPGFMPPDETDEREKESTPDRRESPARDNLELSNRHHDSTQQAALKAQLPTTGSNVMPTAISKTNVVGFMPPDETDEREKESTPDRRESPARDNLELANRHHDSTQQAALKAQLPTTGSSVMLTAISKTNVVFVRSVAYGDNLEFFKTVSIIQRVAKSQRSIQHTPCRGDIVLTKFKEDQFNRAMVLNPDDLDNIKLIYIDYGNIDSRSLDQLLNAPDQFWNLPRMAVPIILQNVPDFFMTDEVKKYMYSNLNTDMKIVYKPDDLVNGIHQAELFNLESNESFNKRIASLRAPTLETGAAPVLFKNYLESLPLPDGEKVELIVMDNSLLQTAFVSCTTEDYGLQIQKFQDDIQAYAKLHFKDAPYSPRINELCVAKYDEDNLWYRGRCIERVGDGHPSILFFDYGNISIINVENIRPYPEEFTFPIMTGDCEIHGLPEKVDDELKRKLENELQVGMKIVCDKVVRYTEDNFYSIHLTDLVHKVLN